jgi:hypothetical protein
MGHEHDVTTYQCGCEEHHEYDEYCGMGAVDGTSKRYWRHCRYHGRLLNQLADGPHRTYESNKWALIRNIESQPRLKSGEKPVDLSVSHSSHSSHTPTFF